MDASRPTKEITTTNGHKAVLRAWISFQEYREIMSIYMRAMRVQSDGKGAETAELSGAQADTMLAAQDAALKRIVVSLDGSTENVLERMQNLPNDDAQEIVAAVEAISNPKKK